MKHTKNLVLTNDLTIHLSDHFTLHEMVSSGIALRFGIDNTPTPEVVENLRFLCRAVLEPLRLRYGRIIIPAGYSQILITYRISLFPNEEQHAQEYINNIADNKYLIFVDTYTLASVDGGAKAGQADVTLSITDIQYSNSAQDRREVEVLGSGKTTWRIYGTPVPDDALPADDPHRLSFTSPLRNCGYEAEITTEDSWADISRWRWTVSDDETFKIDPSGNYATLSTPHYAIGGSLDYIVPDMDR